MTVILPGIRIQAAEEGPSDTSGNAVINTDLFSTTIWRRAYVGINDTPKIVASLPGRTCVRNNRDGQKYQIVLPCQILDAKRLRFGSEVDRLSRLEKLGKLGG